MIRRKQAVWFALPLALAGVRCFSQYGYGEGDIAGDGGAADAQANDARVDALAPEGGLDATLADAADGSTNDSSSDAASSCDGGSTLCGGKCVDTSADMANCGACGVACGGGMPCVAGSCATCVKTSVKPVALWRANGDTLDATGAHPAAARGTLSYVAGKSGSAFAMGKGDVAAPDSQDFRLSGKFSLAAWINLPVNFVGQNTIVAKNRTPSGTGFNLGVTGDGSFYFGTCTPCSGPVSPPATIVGGGWHHVAVTASGANATLYVDGSVVATTSSLLPISQGATPLVIGSEDGVVGRIFNGSIDEVAVFPDVLSAADVKAIVAGGTSGLCN